MSTTVPQADSGNTLSLDSGTAERALVEHCIAGDEAAWREVYRRYHGGLLRSIHAMFGGQSWDSDRVDEIAARVWYVMVSNRYQMLDRFDPQRGGLATFLAVIARSEGLNALRSEKRRQQREQLASRSLNCLNSVIFVFEEAEFRETLTLREREFFDRVLARPAEKANEFTSTNRWQLRSRIRVKLERFIEAQA
jgi:DNA-directed RNA polymerase specialized sigma24 family protein